MNILIAGFGGVGQAVHTLLEHFPIPAVTHIDIADASSGLPAEIVIEQKKDTLDLVINLTTDANAEIFRRCQAYGIHYLDTGFPNPRDVVSILSGSYQPGTINLFGFGMNPGLIEFMYRRQHVNKPHIAMLVEWDTAQGEPGLFCSWSPHNYLDEAAVDEPFFYANNTLQNIAPPDIALPAGKMFDGESREYLWVPHEEIYSIGHSNQFCTFCGFLYSAPEKIQQLAKKLRGTDAEIPGDIPLLRNLRGYDTVGILFADETDEATYIFNRGDHEHCYQKYGINGTCWQVACGVHTALAIFEHIKPGTYTMSAIPEQLDGLIEENLNKLGFSIEKRTIPLSDMQKQFEVHTADGRTYHPFTF